TAKGAFEKSEPAALGNLACHSGFLRQGLFFLGLFVLLLFNRLGGIFIGNAALRLGRFDMLFRLEMLLEHFGRFKRLAAHSALIQQHRLWNTMRLWISPTWKKRGISVPSSFS